MIRTSKLSTRAHLVRASLVVAAAACAALPASAANPPIAIVGPAEWNLPIVPSANVVMQTGVFQENDNSYDSGGHEVAGPGGQVYEGLTRFAHLFTMDFARNTGFFWEYLQPEVDVQPAGAASTTGLGDPLLDFGVYRSPTKSFTIGFQQILSIPVGSQQVSNHAWIYLPSVIFDWHPANGLGFDGTVGAGVFSGLRGGGVAEGHAPGSLFYAQTSLRYQANSWLAPFVDNVYQTENSSQINPSNHEDDIGGGAKINFTPGRWLSIWYMAGVEGANTGRTNAIYFRFVDIL